MRKLVLLILTVLPAIAVAAPADWKSYLFRYGKDAASEQVQLVKVNEKDARVVVNNRDKAAKFTPDGISFDGPPEVFWSMSKDGSKLASSALAAR